MNKSILLVTTALGAVVAVLTPAAAQIKGGAPVGGQQGIGPAMPETITITAQQLNAARNGIETDIGASTYSIGEVAIQSVPGGDNTLLNQVILQAPDVAQDSFGQFHVRGEHAEIQYRIDGIILPEGISVFGQTLSPRLIDSMKLLTGALPAEFGLRNAGVIDITTKSGALDTGGDISIYGGSHSTYNPSVEYGGTSGNLTYFVSGDYLHDLLGIESPDGSSTPQHDKTNQYHGFAMLEDFLDPADRVSLLIGTSHDNFQIPNQVGLSPSLGLTVNGQTGFPSENLNETQSEITHFGIVSFQHSQDLFDVQTSLIARYSSLSFTPDPLGDLLYNGIAQTAFKSNLAYAWQTDSAFHVIQDHTIRAGFYIQDDHGISKTSSQVLPADANGVQTTDVPQTIIDNYGKTEKIYSFYLQDEWKVFETFTLNYGFRYDEVQAFTSGSMIEPRVNAVWQPFMGTILHAGYAKYLTPPPFEQINNVTVSKFVNTTAAPSVTQDDTPVVERANYYDVGANQIIIPGLTVGLDTYAKFDHDLIDEGQFGAPIILTPFNYKDGRQYGAELTTNYTSPTFTAYANFALQHAIGKQIVSSEFNFSPDDLAYIATHFIDLDHEQHFTASGGVSWLYDGTRISADILAGSGLRASLTLPDGSTIPNGAHLPYYTQTNVGLQHSFDIAGGLIARFDVINVFDIKYQIRNGTGVGVGAPQWGPRRGFFFGLEKTF
ncbi:MAG: TonB-dependent receptor [Alphaproteobacteria bacterium]|nr:TonB-dependent receptor [Alphaproteobacteria bacterium]